VELRLAGTSYDDIASALGFANRSGSWKAVQRALGSRVTSATDRYRMVRYAELDAEHRASWPAAKLGDVAAVSRCLKAAGERALLMDLA
jgi:hypothetical protein